MSANPTDVNQANSASAPAGKTYEQELRELEELLGEKFPPLIRAGREAFRRDFPQLQKKHRGWWVAYSGDQQIAIARSDLPLYEECFRRGLKRTEFVVLQIDPEELIDVHEWEILTPEMDASGA